MNNQNQSSKLTPGEVFQFALTIQFALVLIASFVLLIKAADQGTLTTGKFFIGLAVCYNSLLPVLFARCLASIERNTAQNSHNQDEPKVAATPIARPEVSAPVVAPTPPTPIDTNEKATVIGDTIICPNCGKAQRSNRAICFDCGTALKTE